MTHSQKTVHFIPEFFQDPYERISILVIGAGGNGSQMISALSRINHALTGLGHPGIIVTLMDDDTVEQSNIGRQLFTANDLGDNKAVNLITRFNRCYGTDWRAVPKRFEENMNITGYNIIITCVDNVKARLAVAKAFDAIEKKMSGISAEDTPYYWLDLGNAQETGQVILGSQNIKQPKTKLYQTVSKLPCVHQMIDLSKVNEKDSGPSCSLAEALEKQDLFINSALVQCGASLLWSLLKDAALEAHGFFLNLGAYKMNPIPIIKK